MLGRVGRGVGPRLPERLHVRSRLPQGQHVVLLLEAVEPVRTEREIVGVLTTVMEDLAAVRVTMTADRRRLEHERRIRFLPAGAEDELRRIPLRRAPEPAPTGETLLIGRDIAVLADGLGDPSRWCLHRHALVGEQIRQSEVELVRVADPAVELLDAAPAVPEGPVGEPAVAAMPHCRAHQLVDHHPGEVGARVRTVAVGHHGPIIGDLLREIKPKCSSVGIGVPGSAANLVPRVQRDQVPGGVPAVILCGVVEGRSLPPDAVRVRLEGRCVGGRRTVMEHNVVPEHSEKRHVKRALKRCDRPHLGAVGEARGERLHHPGPLWYPRKLAKPHIDPDEIAAPVCIQRWRVRAVCLRRRLGVDRSGVIGNRLGECIEVFWGTAGPPEGGEDRDDFGGVRREIIVLSGIPLDKTEVIVLGDQTRVAGRRMERPPSKAGGTVRDEGRQLRHLLGVIVRANVDHRRERHGGHLRRALASDRLAEAPLCGSGLWLFRL